MAQFSATEFWGVEVKSGESLKIEIVPAQFVLHLSQAALGEVKKDKGNESVCLYVKITDRDEKFVLGTLNPEKFPQLSFDLVFEKNFELSHNWKNGSVYFIGYKILQPERDDDSELSEPEFDLGEGLPVASNNGRKQQALAQKDKLNSTEPKQKVKIIEPSKDDKACEESDDDSNSSSEDDTSDDQDMTANQDYEDSSESEDEDDESEDEEEETPKMVQKEKKRSAEPAMRTPVPDKKAKLVTLKSDGKKAGGHIATPHPAKKIVKASAKSDQNKKSFGCASCNRSFGSEVALQSHTKAKHSAGQ